MLSSELCRCSSDLYLSSRPPTGLATAYVFLATVEAQSVNATNAWSGNGNGNGDWGGDPWTNTGWKRDGSRDRNESSSGDGDEDGNGNGNAEMIGEG